MYLYVYFCGEFSTYEVLVKVQEYETNTFFKNIYIDRES